MDSVSPSHLTNINYDIAILLIFDTYYFSLRIVLKAYTSAQFRSYAHLR